MEYRLIEEGFLPPHFRIPRASFFPHAGMTIHSVHGGLISPESHPSGFNPHIAVGHANLTHIPARRSVRQVTFTEASKTNVEAIAQFTRR